MIIIGCVCRGYGIGKNGKIPWKNSNDMKFFREITNGCTVLVGRNTTLPPLKNRTVVVLENRNTIDDIKYRDALLIGGATVWRDAFKKGYVDSIYLTVIDEDYECDTYFPVEYLTEFNLESIQKLDEITRIFYYKKI